MVFFINKLWTYTWNLVDLIIILMCQSLTNHFHALKVQLESLTDEQTLKLPMENTIQLRITQNNSQIKTRKMKTIKYN